MMLIIPFVKFLCQLTIAGRQQLLVRFSCSSHGKPLVALQLMMLSVPNISFEGDEGKRIGCGRRGCGGGMGLPQNDGCSLKTLLIGSAH